jgi:hypothetical protein
VAPNASRQGIESPMGEPLAMLPASVAVERIGGEPKRRSTSAKSG